MLNQAKTANSYALLVFFFFLGAYLLTAGGHFYNQDGYLKFLTTETFFKGTGPFHPRFYTIGLDGRMTTSFPVGTSLWMVPLYTLGQLTTAICSIALPAIKIDSRLFFAPLFSTFLNTFFCAACCSIFYSLGRRMQYTHRSTLLATACLGFGTMLWPYSKFCYSEPQAAFFILSSFLFVFRYREMKKIRFILFVGIFFSLGLITKYEILLILPAFIGYLFFVIRASDYRTKLFFWTHFLGGLSLAFIVISGWNFLRFGTILELGRYHFVRNNPLIVLVGMISFLVFAFCLSERKSLVLIERFKKNRKKVIFLVTILLCFYLAIKPQAFVQLNTYLFSSGKSIFLFSPSLVLSIFLLKNFYKKNAAEAYLIMSLPLLYLLLLPYHTYNATWQWGPRYFVTLLPFMVLPLLELGQAVTNSAFKKGISTIVLSGALAVQTIAICVSYQDTFNYTSQKIATEENIELNNFKIEKKIVFPKMLKAWNYSPIRMQSLVLASLVGKELPELKDPLLFKKNVKKPSQWYFDFWWVYLYYYKMSVAVLAVFVSLLVILMGICFKKIIAADL